MTEQTQSVAVSERAVAPGAAAPGAERSASLWADAWRDLRRRPIAIASATVILLVSSMAAVPVLWTRVDPRDCDIKLSKAKPSGAHIFGTNELGCDYYSMTVHGARASILVALFATGLVLTVGSLIGMTAGFYGVNLALCLDHADHVLGPGLVELVAERLPGDGLVLAEVLHEPELLPVVHARVESDDRDRHSQIASRHYRTATKPQKQVADPNLALKRHPVARVPQ